MMNAAVYTLGCKVNQYESQELADLLRSGGFNVVSPDEASDVYIVNSCTVTAESSRKTRQAVRRFKRDNPDAVIILTGCLPQAFKDEAADINEADIVIGNNSNDRLIELINEYLVNHKRIVESNPHKRNECYKSSPITEFEGHTRAFVKIQDGCNRYCSYCAIPYARGFSRSRDIDDIKRELYELKSKGYNEVVFVGINLTAYGMELEDHIDVADVCLAAADAGFPRIRLGSLEPDHITDELITKLADVQGFCPQFHLSLQSGCDRILKRMNRHYTSQEYYELAEKLRLTFPGAAITTDIITGFPGESEDDFLETVDFVKKIGFEKVHVFPFSRRNGTPAAEMKDQVRNVDKIRRAHLLGAAADEIRRKYFESCIGKSFEVLFESGENGNQNGYTPNYTPVYVKTEQSLTGLILPVKIINANKDGCEGSI